MPSKSQQKRKYNKQQYANRNTAGVATLPSHSENDSSCVRDYDSLAGAPASTCVHAEAFDLPGRLRARCIWMHLYAFRCI